MNREHKRVGTAFPRTVLLSLILVLAGLTAAAPVLGQGGAFTLLGDVKVDESKADGLKPLSLDIILYTLGGNVVGRQRVPNNGRYRFMGLRSGEYDISIESENNEVARIRVVIGGMPNSDFRQDIELEWKGGLVGSTAGRKQTISAADFYKRTGPNQSIFEKAQSAVDKKKYDEAVTLFRQLIDLDAQDFQAWTELGTTYLLMDKKDEAEKSYLHATEIRPAFALAQMNLGRVRSTQKKFEEAIPPLTAAVDLQPQSAEANYLLGEAYLQIRKGSKAVGYLTEAARLGRTEAHLRLAALFNAAGLKDKAALEYEEFLKKTPNYAERKKLEAYITANKKP